MIRVVVSGLGRIAWHYHLPAIRQDARFQLLAVADPAADRRTLMEKTIFRPKDRPEVTIEYFVPDERKSGGAYVTETGVVRHISITERLLVMEDGAVIPMNETVFMP